MVCECLPWPPRSPGRLPHGFTGLSQLPACVNHRTIDSDKTCVTQPIHTILHVHPPVQSEAPLLINDDKYGLTRGRSLERPSCPCPLAPPHPPPPAPQRRGSACRTDFCTNHTMHHAEFHLDDWSGMPHYPESRALLLHADAHVSSMDPSRNQSPRLPFCIPNTIPRKYESPPLTSWRTLPRRSTPHRPHGRPRPCPGCH